MYGTRLLRSAHPAYHAAAVVVAQHSVFVPVGPSADSSYQSFRGHRAFFTCTGSRNTIGCTIIWSFSGVPHGHKFLQCVPETYAAGGTMPCEHLSGRSWFYPLVVVQDRADAAILGEQVDTTFGAQKQTE